MDCEGKHATLPNVGGWSTDADMFQVALICQLQEERTCMSNGTMGDAMIGHM
jgi:hypothetical protein